MKDKKRPLPHKEAKEAPPVRSSTCDSLHKELMEKSELVMSPKVLGEMFFGALTPFVNKVNTMAVEWESLKNIVVRQNDRIKQLEKEVAGLLTEEMTKRRAAAARKRG